VTVVWVAEHRVMPMREGQALAAAFPHSRLEDSYVLVPLDQPERMAELLREHVAWQRSAGSAHAPPNSAAFADDEQRPAHPRRMRPGGHAREA
jgi:hypothetical protein